MKITCYRVDREAPDLVPGKPDRDWMDHFTDRHPYRCLPLVMANTTGWELISPASFSLTWTGGTRVEDIRIDSDDDYPREKLARLVTSHFSHGVLTFHTGYLFRTEPGWDMWVGGPPNIVKDGLQPLVGVVETDWLPFPFTMNWRFTRPGFASFKKGEPFCFIMPVPHAVYDAVQPIVKDLFEDPELLKEYQAWSESRTSFLANLGARDPETLRQGWQRHYFKGLNVATQQTGAETHIHRRRLNAPRRAKPGE